MSTIWRTPPSEIQEQTRTLANMLNVDPFIGRLLVKRGIDTFDKARDFFRPSLSHLHDPLLMKDMDKAVERLTAAVMGGEKIMIYGDYDVDGTTSVALFVDFLRNIEVEVHYYIPDRAKEGYGVSERGVKKAAELGCTLFITLDCGITAIDAIRLAGELGMDTIVCDHHQPGDELPGALAVLDPQRSDCEYPYKHLSGCGVGFKLLQAFVEEQSMDKEVLWGYLDLLCVSIAADIVQITGENRVLAYFGLQRIQSNPRPGIRALLESASFEKSSLSISDVVFIIAPRINAAGRMDHAINALEVLLAPTLDKARELAKAVERNNLARRELDQAIAAEAVQQVENDPWLQESWVTVVADEDWHKGVIGIVASRLIQQYFRPTIVFTESNGTYTGSARSVEGLDIYDCLSECSDLLIQFGGHTMAAGMTMKKENLIPFREKFDEVVRTKLTPEMRVPKIDVDEAINFNQINNKTYRILKQFAPFGPGNMRPVFMTKDVVNARWTKAVGSDEAHLKLHVRQEGISSPEIGGIAFGMGEHLTRILEGEPFDMVYTLEENEWNGSVDLQLNVKDIKFQKEPTR